MTKLPTLDRGTRARLLERSVRRDASPLDEFAGREAEIAWYLDHAAGRYATTLELLDQVLAGRRPKAILELGADPWLMTQLLLERGYEVVSAGRPPGVWEPDASVTPQTITLAWAGREERLAHHLFDVERDRWPFPEGAFELVLCTEVLEHLVYSPGHLLYEASRTLVDGGLLVLTTPNALAATKLGRILAGRNVHGVYSGYGAHGRHNREFSAAELEALLTLAGLDAQVFAVDLAGYEAPEPLARALQLGAGLLPPAAGRRDHLFAVGRKTRPPRLAFPPALYRSFDRDRMRRQGVVLVDEPPDATA
jgi:SAM-dependent methyltransferase